MPHNDRCVSKRGTNARTAMPGIEFRFIPSIEIIRPAMGQSIEAGKHVYCEWPLGRNTDEAVRMRDAANRAGIRHAVGLQGQVSPAICTPKTSLPKAKVVDPVNLCQRPL